MDTGTASPGGPARTSPEQPNPRGPRVSLSADRPLRLTLRVAPHPEGTAPRVLNLGRWRAHLLDRLWREVEWTDEQDQRYLLRESSL